MFRCMNGNKGCIRKPLFIRARAFLLTKNGKSGMLKKIKWCINKEIFDMLFDVCHALLRVCAVRCGRLAGRLRRRLVFVGLYYADAQR